MAPYNKKRGKKKGKKNAVVNLTSYMFKKIKIKDYVQDNN